jgi:hypothetical protein
MASAIDLIFVIHPRHLIEPSIALAVIKHVFRKLQSLTEPVFQSGDNLSIALPLFPKPRIPQMGDRILRRPRQPEHVIPAWVTPG